MCWLGYSGRLSNIDRPVVPTLFRFRPEDLLTPSGQTPPRVYSTPPLSSGRQPGYREPMGPQRSGGEKGGLGTAGGGGVLGAWATQLTDASRVPSGKKAGQYWLISLYAETASVSVVA